MQKLVELNTDPNVLVSSNVLKFMRPDFVYIPIDNGTILVKQNTLVKIGTPLIKEGDKIITSSVSGTVKAIKDVKTINGSGQALEIANDFSENKLLETSVKRNLKRIKKDALDNIFKSNFKININGKKNLILNCIDDEPYVLNENFYLFLYYDGFLELLDTISKESNFNKIIICVRQNSSENINKLIDCLGMYPNIELNVVPNFYLLGHSCFLSKYLGLDIKDSCVIKASKFYDIYNLIKRNDRINDKLITISGDGLKNPSVVKLKIGSQIKDVIDSLIETYNNVEYIAGGSMTGKIIDLNNFIVTEDLNAVLIMKKQKERKIGKCINCGACVDICPVNINPLLLGNKKYYAKVSDKCLDCGLCSYICPVNINFKKGDDF